MAWSVAEIVSAVAAAALRPTDVLDEHVARHHATAAALNALVQHRHAAAREDAAALERASRGAAIDGPLVGVPVSVKECFGVRGLVTSLGIPSLREAVDVGDAAIVSRLRAVGAIVVGKANVSQAMYLHDADNPVWGRTNHPLDAARGPGGSSGGDAALVAADVVPLAVGNDLAGSVRQPAHACGIAGFLPRSRVLGEGGGFDTMPRLRVVRPRAGLLARRVADLSLAFSAITGAARGAHTGETAVAGPSLRVAWWDDAGPIEPSPAVRRAVHEAVARLSQAGVSLVRLDGGLAAEAAWLHLALLSADGGADVRGLFGGTRPIPPVARLLRLAGVPRCARRPLAAAAWMIGSRIEAQALGETGPRAAAARDRLLEERAALAARCHELAGSFDAAVCPVSALPALRHGTAARLVLAAAPCLLANLLDLPAGAVPVTRVRPDEQRGRGPSRDPVVRAADDTDRGSEGLPIGVQVIGLPQAEDVDGQRGERVVLDVMRLIADAAE
jgi:fatty acid amide hydrolase